MPIIISWSMWTSARKTYQFCVLPFGLSTAPREFTKTLALLVQLLRTRGIRVHAYLNDWIIRADSSEQSLLHTNQTIQLLQTLGWTIKWKKSMLEPSRILDFLGLHFNLEQAIVSPPDSLDSLISVLSHLSASTVMSACKITSITSRISHFAPFIHHGCLHFRFLQFWIKRKHWLQGTQSWDTQIQLDTEFLTHLRWFNRQEVLQGVPLHSYLWKFVGIGPSQDSSPWCKSGGCFHSLLQEHSLVWAMWPDRMEVL